jgi:hypothetical protein
VSYLFFPNVALDYRQIIFHNFHNSPLTVFLSLFNPVYGNSLMGLHVAFANGYDKTVIDGFVFAISL